MTQFIGQTRLTRLIRDEAASGGLFRHTLLHGPPGLGKTSLAKVIALETGAEFVPHIAGANWDFRKVEAELMALDTTGYGDGGVNITGKKFVFFVDEVHLFKSFEPFYEPLQNWQIVRAGGGYAWIPDVTFVFATSKLNKVPKPARDRFPLHLRVDPYSVCDLARIIRQQFPTMAEATAKKVAARSRGTARLALSYGESVWRHGLGFFESAEIDARGLTALDREYLQILRSSDRPLSIGTIASLTGETPATLSEIVEPYLLSIGLIEITTKGRIPTGNERGARLAPPSMGLPLSSGGNTKVPSGNQAIAK